MISFEDCHKCWKVRVYVKPNIDETYHVIAASALVAMQRATEILNLRRGCKLIASQCVIEVTKTELEIWFDKEDWG